MMPTAAVVMSSAMSSCAGTRSRERRTARGSGSRCCSTAGSGRGPAHGTRQRPPLAGVLTAHDRRGGR